MKVWLFFPFVLQGFIMLVDEFYFHKRRGLPRWERLGHPLDTFTVLISFAWLMTFRPNETSLQPFMGLALFSCLFVTKDEFVHRQNCSASELWIHSLLFILHPVCFFSAGWMWMAGGFEPFLKGQTLLLFLFMVYQTVYWNLLWKPQNSSLNPT